MMKKLLCFTLSIVGLFFLLSCVSPETTDGLSAEDLAVLPADLQPEKESALTGQAIYEQCVDPDAASTFSREQLQVRSTTTFDGGSRTDRCYTWYAGTSREKTRLIEGVCRGSRFQYWYADCSSGSRCQEGACVVCTPRVEICDGIDNNCNAIIDEGGVCATPQINTTTNVTNQTVGNYSLRCVDNDPANSPTTRGTLTIINSSGGVLPVTWSNLENRLLTQVDSCYGAAVGSINETTCNPNANYYWDFPRSIIVSCPSGTTCTDPDGFTGATPAICATPQINTTTNVANQTVGNYSLRCVDNDLANSPTTRGTLTIINSSGGVLPVTWSVLENRLLTQVDSCYGAAAGSINETTCNTNANYYWDFPRSIIVSCPSGTTCTDPDGFTGATPAVCS